MSKVIVIADSHAGIRNDSVNILNNQQLLYDNLLFPTIKEQKITHILHLGDLFDRRKYINFNTLSRFRQMFLDRLVEENITMDICVGNHDVYYKSTNELNSLQSLLNQYPNIKVYTETTELDLFSEKILFIPWISPENKQRSLEAIDKSRALIAAGHLELSGFEMFKGSVAHEGMSPDIFSKFDLVMSGHYHHKSSSGNIHYVGAPSQYTWGDWDDPRGFHILDVKTKTLQFIENPYQIFHKLYYDDVNNDYTQMITDETQFDLYKGCYVKIVIVNKENPYWLETIVSKLEKNGVADVQMIENHYNIDTIEEADMIEISEDTMSLLSKFTSSIKNKKQRVSVETILHNLLTEAQTIDSEV